MTEPKASVSQGTEGFIDDGGESAAINAAPPVEEEEMGSDAPSEEAEAGAGKEGGEETPEEKGGKKEKEEVEEEAEIPDDKLPKGVVKRLGEMRRKQGDAERDAARLRAELEELRQAQQAEKDIGPKPDASDYETEAAYLDALTDWKVKKALAEHDKKAQERAEADRKAREDADAEERHKENQKRLKDGAKKYKDFAETVYREDLPITGPMTEILSRFENMADVAYFLGKNPDKCADIAHSGPADQALALKEIADTLKAKERKTTNAPRPLKPIATTGAGIKDLESMSYPEYRKAMEQAEKERRGG